MILAGGIKRDYALYHVFSRSVADAHARGDIHLHDLGFIDRIVDVHQPIRMLKRQGLDLPSTLTVARPARHAEVLLAHLVRWSSIMRGYVSGTVSWEALNISFAPYTEKMDERELNQFAQMFVYEFSQLASATGGQTMSTDIHLYWQIPPSMVNLPMIGPGGKETGKLCGDYLSAARRLARALVRVYREGDGEGKPFVFPRPIIHLPGDEESQAYREFLAEVGELALEKGNPCFFFHRGKEDTPAYPRLSQYVFHHCTINMPRLGYLAQGDDSLLIGALARVATEVVKAHKEKRKFLERLLSYGKEGPLMFLEQPSLEGKVFDLEDAYCLVGLVGLDELGQLHLGAAGKHPKERLPFVLSLVAKLGEKLKVEGEKEGLRILLGQIPAEAISHRFARLDLRYHSPLAGRVVRGDLAGGGVYYTDAGFLASHEKLSAWDRVSLEGELQRLMPGGGTTYLWLGNERLTGEQVTTFLCRVHRETNCRELAFAPDFTLCRSCRHAVRGCWEKCPQCQGTDVDGMSVITRYFSRVSWWNKGKQAELKDRYRYSSSLL